MDHQEAMRIMAAEKYLLNELPPDLRDDFEVHYFDCPECAADVRATAAFLDATKKEFETATVPGPSPAKKSPFEFLWRPAFALPAFALLLLVIAYQNVVVYPHLASEVAQLRAPQILPSLSLVGGNSRGGESPSIAVRKLQPFVVSVDIPTQDRFSSYTCVLYSPSGSTAFSIRVSAQQAKDTVSVNVPAGVSETGTYTLAVQGNTDRVPAEPAADLAHYRFVVTNPN
jgi:Putative zinc-finger